jgi:hypothetical protein
MIPPMDPILGHYNDHIESIMRCFIELMKNEDLQRMVVSAVPKIINNGMLAAPAFCHVFMYI